jgi:hypothetical protein
MDLLLDVVAVFVLAIPLGFAGALFLRVAPAAFGFRPQAEMPWPVGVQEEDPETAWARRAVQARPEPEDEADPIALTTVSARMGRGSSRR